MKKINDNIKIFITTIIICIIIFYLCYLYIYNNSNNNNLVIIFTLLGSFISGILTMVGVCWTITFNYNKKEKDEKLYIVREAKILKADIAAYTTGILNFNQRIIFERTNSTLIKQEFDNMCRRNFVQDNIIFMSNETKDRFYKLLSYEMNENVLSIFVEFYNRYEKFKESYYNETLSLSGDILFRSGFLVLNNNYLNCRYCIFNTYVINELNYPRVENNLVLNNFDEVNIQNNLMNLNSITNFYSNELNTLNQYLDDVIHKYSD